MSQESRKLTIIIKLLSSSEKRKKEGRRKKKDGKRKKIKGERRKQGRGEGDG